MQIIASLNTNPVSMHPVVICNGERGKSRMMFDYVEE
jgi:hypothetical protein